jgi:ribosomal protein S27E
MGEIEKKMVNEADRVHPYLYCDKCKHLSPIKTNTLGYYECMVCSLVIIPSKGGGRTVLFTRAEAAVRGLPVVHLGPDDPDGFGGE